MKYMTLGYPLGNEPEKQGSGQILYIFELFSKKIWLPPSAVITWMEVSCGMDLDKVVRSDDLALLREKKLLVEADDNLGLFKLILECRMIRQGIPMLNVSSSGEMNETAIFCSGRNTVLNRTKIQLWRYGDGKKTIREIFYEYINHRTVVIEQEYDIFMESIIELVRKGLIYLV